METVHHAFYGSDHYRINTARIEHLEYLDLDLKNKKVLETGCGGKGDFTKWLLSKGSIVTLNDSRLENIECLLKNLESLEGLEDMESLENIKYNTWDLNKDLEDPSEFDVIFSYGTLYHLGHPDVALKNLASMCKGFLIMSTCVSRNTDSSVNLINENSDSKNQSSTGVGCRPTRKWIIEELKKYFKYVCISKMQPNHEDYPSNWNNWSGTSRAVFLATNDESVIDSSKWSVDLLDIQEKIQ
jgi:hypothetical protein